MLKTVEVRLSEIKPYKNNAKKHDKCQIENVAESIKQFGWRQPVVIDKNKVIIIGHCRYEAAKLLGYETIPCNIAEDLTEEQTKKLRLLDNKLNESEWDLDLLPLELEELDMEEFGLDWGLISPEGFGTDFSIASGDKPIMEKMTFTLHREQAEAVRLAIDTVLKNGEITETFGNANKNGNALYEVIRQWEEQRK